MTAVAVQSAIDPDAEFDLAREEILHGRGADAVRRMRAIIAQDGDNPIRSWWLAAALGAAGDWEAHRQALTDAAVFHAAKLVEACGGDVERMRRDPAYAAVLGKAFYENDYVAVAALPYGIAAAAPKAAGGVMLTYGLTLQHQGLAEASAQAFADACARYPASANAHSFLLYSLFYVEDGVNRHAEAARAWARRYAHLKTPDAASFANPPLGDRPLKVGYVLPSIASGQARQFLGPVLEHHDPKHVQVTLYLEKAEDAGAHTVRVTEGLNDDEHAELIRADGIDVLVDLWGHTSGGRLGVFARKPAPVQASWLNYVQTTGLKAIDYLVHADCMDAEGAQDQCEETIWRLGPVIAPFRPDERPAPTPTPAKAAGHVTFGSYNHPARLNDATIAAWARILKRTPGSQLLLRYKYFIDEVLQNRTLMRFAAHGVDVGRIVFAAAEKQPAYYQSYAEIDLALDPAPTPGGTTSLDAVANGVPLLTLRGPDYFSRIGVAVVEPLGLKELIASDWDDYVERAVALASDVQALDELRARTRRAFDGSGRRDEAGFTRRLETAFRGMYSLWDRRRG